MGRHKFLVDTLRQCVSPSQRIMQGLRIIFVPTILILRYFYPHQLIGVYSGIVLHERKAGSRKARWYVQLSVSFFRVREGLLLIMVPFSVMFCLRVCCCLLLLCSRVPSPAVLCVHRPLLSLLNSHAPSSSARHRRAQLITPLLARSLWRTPHRFIDFSLCGLTGSFCRLPRPIAPTN